MLDYFNMKYYVSPSGSMHIMEDYMHLENIVYNGFISDLQDIISKYSKYTNLYELDEKLVYTSSLMYSHFNYIKHSSNSGLYNQFLKWDELAEYDKYLEDIKYRYTKAYNDLGVDLVGHCKVEDYCNSPLTDQDKILSIVAFIRSKPFQSVNIYQNTNQEVYLEPQVCFNHITPREDYYHNMDVYSIELIPDILYELMLYYKQVKELLTADENEGFNKYCYSIVKKFYKVCNKSIIDDFGYYYCDFYLFISVLNKIIECIDGKPQDILPEYIGFLLNYKNIKFITDIYIEICKKLYPRRHYTDDDIEGLILKCMKFIKLIASAINTSVVANIREVDTEIIKFLPSCDDSTSTDFFVLVEECKEYIEELFSNEQICENTPIIEEKFSIQQIEDVKQIREDIDNILQTYEQSKKEVNILSLFDDNFITTLINSPFYDVFGCDRLLHEFNNNTNISSNDSVSALSFDDCSSRNI